MSRAAILILGMHRSGTSALTWLLGQMGAALPGDAIAAHGDNARGYWESEALVRADDQLLRVCRSSWFDPRPLDWSRLPPDGLRSRKARMREAIETAWGDAPLLAIKDPRQCRFVPIIAEMLADMGVEARAVLMLREPADIARSLAARDGTTPAYAHLLWLRHMIDAERTTRDMPRAVLSYEGMMRDWRSAVAALGPVAGRPGWQPDGALADEIERFIDPALRHHDGTTQSLEEPLAGIVAAVSTALHALTDTDDPAVRDTLDRVYAMLDAAPWLEGDLVHDELRHRRMPPVDESAEESNVIASPPPQDFAEDIALIRASGLFDEAWYLQRYPDVAAAGMDPVEHYCRHGAAEGRNPSGLFDTVYYARQMAGRMAAEARAAS